MRVSTSHSLREKQKSLYIWNVSTVFRFTYNREGICTLPLPPFFLSPFAMVYLLPVAYQGILFGVGGGSTNSVEDRQNGDLEAVAP